MEIHSFVIIKPGHFIDLPEFVKCCSDVPQTNFCLLYCTEVKDGVEQISTFQNKAHQGTNLRLSEKNIYAI